MSENPASPDAQAQENKKPTLKDLFQIRDYRFLYAGQIVSNIGDSMTNLALLLLINKITESVTALATMAIVLAIPSLTFGLLSGVYVDRLDRKKIMVFSDIFRGLAVLGFLLVKDAEDIWILFVIGFIQASIGTFFAPARSALIPNIVGKDKLLAANSISETSRIIFGLIGTGLAGWIIGSSENFSLIFLIDAATFFLSMILITQIAYKHSYATDDDKITAQLIFSQLREGLKTTFGNPVLRGVIMAFATVMLGLGAVNILLVPLLVNDLQVPETWFAALEFSQTASMILAGSLVAVLAARFKPTKILGTSLIGLGIGVAAISLVGNVYHVMIVLFLVGWFIAPVQAAGSTILQTTVPDEVRGRTGSANNAIIQTANLISMGLAGYLADAIGTRNVFIIGGALVCIAGLIAFAIFRGVKMPDPEGIQAQTSNI